MTIRSGFPVALAAALLIVSIAGAPRTVSAHATDAPEISRSAGVAGGIVVLWPRIIPADYRSESHDEAAFIQQRLVDLVRAAYPGRPIDVRPSPERVCGQAGCKAISVGAVLLREQNGVAVVALVSEPGRSPSRMIPWAGLTTLRQTMVPFRQPPESYVVVSDFGQMSSLRDDLRLNTAPILAAIRDAGR